MLLNPNDYIRLLGRVDTTEANVVLDMDIQPNGIDIRVKDIWKLDFFEVAFPFEQYPQVTAEGGSRRILPLKNTYQSKKFRLSKGFAYDVRSQLRFKEPIPDGVAALIIGRSSFNRYGMLTFSSIYDTGFSGRIAATMYAFTNAIVDDYCRFAQLVFIEAKNAGVYKGRYQEAIGLK